MQYYLIKTRKVKLRTISLTIFSFLLLGCNQVSSLHLDGRIEENLYAKLLNNNQENRTLVVSSQGGETDYAYKMAVNIVKNNNVVIVDKVCLSACAEDLIPAAKYVKFQNKPMIGFHRNSHMNRAQMLRYGGDVTHCSSTGLNNQDYLYGLKNLDVAFWKEIEKRLELEFYQVVPKVNSCPWKKRQFKNYMWLPSSEQLRSLWGLEFSGSVCADDFEICRKKIDRRWKKGTRIVVGDEVYVSKGR